MGLANRVTIAGALADAGWPARTPAAVLVGASRPGADAWHGTLDGLHAENVIEIEEGDLPGIIVVGAVAALAGIISAQDAGGQDAVDPLRTSASSR